MTHLHQSVHRLQLDRHEVPREHRRLGHLDESGDDGHALSGGAWPVLRVRDLPTLRRMFGMVLDSMRPHGAGVSLAASVSFANNVATTVAFDTEEIDERGDVDLAALATRITIPTSGWYQCDARMLFASTTSGREALQIRKNGSIELADGSDVASANGSPDLHATAVRHFTQGDYIELLAIQISGGALNVPNATMYPHASIG